MNNSPGRGKSLALRYALLQAACAVPVAVVFGWLDGLPAARAALAGGVIAAVGTALFGWRMFASGIAPVAQSARALYAAEALKWIWLALALWLALAVATLAPLPLVLGLVAAQVGFWIGVAWIR